MIPPLLDNLTDICTTVKRCLVLYSGGLDSSYFLWWARQQGIDVIALHVHLGPGEVDTTVSDIATHLGAELCVCDRTDVFVNQYVALAIQANAVYQHQFPVCSSLSRPLMAAEAVRLAANKGVDCIVHTSTFIQNSAARFNVSLRVLAPHLRIGNPFIREPIARQHKLEQLQAAGVPTRRSVYSVDENIWGRVIECGELDDPAYPVPEHVFLRTRHAVDAPRTSRDVALRFEAGLPVALDGSSMPLRELVTQLNDIGATYGVGRFNGLEDTPLGIKNHEVREAPAAAAIFTAHAALERAVLTQREVRLKSFVDAEWTELVVNGWWYSPLKDALEAFVAHMSRYVSGEVVLQYAPGHVFVRAVRAPHAPHLWNTHTTAEPWFEAFTYREFFELSTIAHRLRLGATTGAQ
jgi:argininosuccinate synthase